MKKNHTPPLRRCAISFWRVWFALLLLLPALGRADLIISQVYEGYLKDRFVEISNTGTSSVDLASYQIAIWAKAKNTGDAATDGITPVYAPLSGTLSAGASRVFKNPTADDPPYAVTAGISISSTIMDFDGNDAIALVSASGAVIDLFGVGINNRSQNYSRKPSATMASAYFNPAEWTASVYTVADVAAPTSGDYLGTYFFETVVPSLVVNPVSLTGLSASLGEPSSSQGYSLTGANLAAATVTVTSSSADFQISTNASTGFSSGLTLTPVAGQLLQTIFVRLSSTAKGGVVAGSITHLSGSALIGLPVSGSVITSDSKAGLRAGMRFSVPNSDFVEQPINEEVTVIEDTSGSIATLQGLIDSARAAQPDRFILVRLRANTTYPVAGSPLILSSKMTLSGAGTTLAAGLTTTAGSLVRISPGSTLVSIDRLTLEGVGKNLYGIEGAGVSRVNVDRVTVRDTGLSGIFLQGLGSTVFNNEMTVTRCTVRGVVNAAGIHFQQATQGVAMENESFNNGTGILLENADHCLVVNNRIEYNATEGICLQDSKSAKVASNLLLGNPIGVGTRGASTSSSSAHFIFRNDIQSATVGISLGQSKDTLYGNSIAAGVSIPLSFSSGAVNRVIQLGSAISAPLQEYFFPPTALNWHTASVKNGQDRVDVSTSATTLSEIQQAYNLARLSQPGRVTVLRLTAPIITGDQPLVLQGDTCIVLEGRINLSPGVTAFQASGTTSAPLGFISISGGTIDGQNTSGRSGMIFTNCSKVLVEGVNLVNFGSKATRVTGSDVILFAGCKDPCIVDSSTISGGAARGIWTKGITGSSLSGMLFLDNVISEVNMDGIDFDTATSSSSAFYNLSQNNIRYGVFVEEGAKNVQVVGNTCSGNDIGINVYSYAVGATEQNTLVANVLSANRRGLRFGAADPEPSTGILTRNNFAFNNRIQNTTTLGAVDAQLDGGENYVSQNVLSANILDYGSTSSAVFLNSPSSAALGMDNAAHANVDFGSGYLDGNLLGQEGWSVYGAGSNGPITVRGGAVELGSGSSYQSVFKSISPYQFGDGASVYLRIDLQVQSASVSGSDFFFITRETDSITGQPIGKSYFRLYVRAAGSGFQIGWNPHAETGATVSPTVPTYADTIFQLNTDYQLVLRCDSTAARNNDDTFLYVNPLRASEAPLLSRTTWVGNNADEFSASTSTGTNRVGGFLNLVLRQPANTPSISMKVKNIVVASAAKDVGLDWVSEVVPTSTIAGAFANNSSNGITTWQGGPGWTPTNPIGGSTTTIIFNGILSGALTANNDSPGNFMLNALSNSITGAGSLTYTGGTFRFVANGNTNPTLTFANNALVQTISNNIQVDAELKVSQAGSTALNSILAGTISGLGGMNKSGTGTVLITRNDNTFDGVATVGAGQLNVLNLGNAGSPSSLGRNSTISLGGGSATGTLRWESVASETSDKSIVLGGSTGGGTLDVRGTANILTLNGPINTGTNAGTRTFTLTGQGGTTVNGLISGNASLRVNGSAARTVTLANTNNSFGGPVTIDGNQSGVSYKVQVASIGNAGLNSPLGTNRTINIGTTNNAFNFLVWSNSVAETTDKTINLAGTVGPALIVNKGPVLLKFTAPVTATGVGVKTFYPDQDDANGVTEFAGEIPNSSGGTTALNKNGPGTLILSTANTFTGGFTLKGGTLELKHDQSLAAGNLLTFPTNGTGSGHVKVAYVGAGPNLGNLLVLTNASIDLGTNPNSKILFGSATNWTNANTILTITNSSRGGQLYITNTNGVVLNQIKSAENSNAIATLNSEGLLTFTNPVPANAKPVVTGAQSFSISEHVPFATPVGTIVATDEDGNLLSGWTIVSGDSGGAFAIDRDTGQIHVTGALNFEGTPSYALGVTVSDGTETSAVGTVIISVTDVSEYSDFFGSSSATADDNGDGISNLMAYALGATSPSSVVVPPELNPEDPTKLTITALIRINDPKVSVVGEYGLTLGNWETASPIAGVDSSNQAGAVAGVTKRQDFSVLRSPDPKKFLHLKATQSQ